MKSCWGALAPIKFWRTADHVWNWPAPFRLGKPHRSGLNSHWYHLGLENGTNFENRPMGFERQVPWGRKISRTSDDFRHIHSLRPLIQTLCHSWSSLGLLFIEMFTSDSLKTFSSERVTESFDILLNLPPDCWCLTHRYHYLTSILTAAPLLLLLYLLPLGAAGLCPASLRAVHHWPVSGASKKLSH